MNKIIIEGNLGSDVALRYSSSGLAVANFSVATNEYFGRNADGTPKQRTTWFRVVVWGKSAENTAKCCGKGARVLIEGRMENNDYVDREGIKRYAMQVVVQNIQFLTRPSSVRSSETVTPEAERPETPDVADLPL